MDEFTHTFPNLIESLTYKLEIPKKKILFLNGYTDRIHRALNEFGEEWDITIVTNARECLRCLSSQDFDEVYLDHDLLGADFEDIYSPDSGMSVVRYLEQTGWPPNKRKPIFRIYSTNLFASYLMVKTLQEAGLMAFYEPIEEDL